MRSGARQVKASGFLFAGSATGLGDGLSDGDGVGLGVLDAASCGALLFALATTLTPTAAAAAPVDVSVTMSLGPVPVVFERLIAPEVSEFVRAIGTVSFPGATIVFPAGSFARHDATRGNRNAGNEAEEHKTQTDQRRPSKTPEH